MSTEEVSAATRARGERQRSRPAGAICFEVGNEPTRRRIHLNQAVEPGNAPGIPTIKARKPDGREYADALPELPHPGFGEQYDECGDDIPRYYCDDCADTKWVGSTCRRSQCPRCWESWCFHQAIEAVTAIDGTRRKRAAESTTNPLNHHAVVSFPAGTRFNSSDALDRGYKAAKRLMMEIGGDTGMLVYHPYRIAEEHRGDVIGHESGSGSMHWKDIMSMPADERDEYLVYAPHFHVFTVSDWIEGGALTRSIEERTDVVVKRIADDNGVSLKNLDALCRAVTYSLTHAGITTAADGQHRAAYRFFGETANIERRSNVRAEVRETMQRVAFDVLGVDFSAGSCSAEAADHDHDHADDRDDGPPAAVRTLSTDTDADGDSDSSGSGGFGFGSSGSGTESGSEWQSGNTGGFASDSSAPDARGMVAVSPDSDDDHDPTDGETCGGDVRPMWTADERLADDEWREKVGEAAAEQLATDYETWQELSTAEPPPG